MWYKFCLDIENNEEIPSDDTDFEKFWSDIENEAKIRTEK